MSHRNDPRTDALGRETAAAPIGRVRRHGVESQDTWTQADDIDLMRDIRAREQDAFEVLYDRYAGHVYNLCRRVTAHDATAEEAVIETFWEIWQRPHRYDARRGTVLTYLLMLARCRAIDRRRGETAASNRRQRWSLHAPADCGARREPADDADEHLADHDVRDALTAAFDRLNPNCQDAVRLCVIQGLTTSEAAHALNVPLGTVKSRIRKSVIQMRRWLRTSMETSDSP